MLNYSALAKPICSIKNNTVEADLLHNSLHLESKPGRNNSSASKTKHSKDTNIHTQKVNFRNCTYVINKKFRAEFIKHVSLLHRLLFCYCCILLLYFY